jgi:hypothetical protein
MAGLVPAIHVFSFYGRVRVDARYEAGHDVVCEYSGHGPYTAVLLPPRVALC